METTPKLSLYQDSCEDILIENNKVKGLRTARGHEFMANYIILTTGTFLRGVIHIGNFQQKSGRIAETSTFGLSKVLENYGFSLGRLKNRELRHGY